MKTLDLLNHFKKRLPAYLSALVIALAAHGSARACTDAEFVTRVFQDVLFRQPTQQELNYYAPNGQLLQGATRFEVAFSVLESGEAKLDRLGGNPGVVQGYFQKFLGRNPTVFELASDLALLGNDTPDFEVMAFLVIGKNDSEYINRAVNLNPGVCDVNSKVVNQLFLDFYGRSAKQAEFDTFVPFLAQGHSLGEVASGITSLDEYFSGVVTKAFALTLHRAPTQNELQAYVGALKQTGLEEEVTAVLMGSDEYCTGQLLQNLPAIPARPPAIQFPTKLVIPEGEVILPPAVPFDALTAAANSSVLGLQGQVANQDAVILQLNAAIDPLRAQVGQLQGQLAAANATIAAQNQTITDVVGELFGMAPTVNSATAARDLARAKVAQALAAAGANNPQVKEAQADLGLGNNALAAGDYSTAEKRFRLAFLHAVNALR